MTWVSSSDFLHVDDDEQPGDYVIVFLLQSHIQAWCPFCHHEMSLPPSSLGIHCPSIHPVRSGISKIFCREGVFSLHLLGVGHKSLWETLVACWSHKEHRNISGSSWLLVDLEHHWWSCTHGEDHEAALNVSYSSQVLWKLVKFILTLLLFLQFYLFSAENPIPRYLSLEASWWLVVPNKFIQLGDEYLWRDVFVFHSHLLLFERSLV